MRGAFDFAEQLLKEDIGWDEVPAHLLPEVKRLYLELLGRLDAADTAVNLDVSHAAIMEAATPRWEK